MKKLRTTSEALLILIRARKPHLLWKDGLRIKETKLARETNLHQPTLHKLLVGSNKTTKGYILETLAAFLKASHDQILGYEPIPEVDKDLSGNLRDENLNEFVTKNGLTSVDVPLLYLRLLSGVDSSEAARRLRNAATECHPMPINSADPATAFWLLIDKALEPGTFTQNEKVLVDPTDDPIVGEYVLIKHKSGQIVTMRCASCDSGYRFICENPIYGEISMKMLEFPYLGVIAERSINQRIK